MTDEDSGKAAVCNSINHAKQLFFSHLLLSCLSEPCLQPQFEMCMSVTRVKERVGGGAGWLADPGHSNYTLLEDFAVLVSQVQSGGAYEAVK